MKRKYISPKIHLHILAQNLLDSLSGGGKDNGNGDAESKRSSFIFDDDIEESMELRHEASLSSPFDL